MSNNNGSKMERSGREDRNSFLSMQNDTVEEEQPAMRHVRLATGAPMLRGAPPSLQKPGWPVGPPPRLARPGMPARTPSGRLNMKKEWTENIRIPKEWVVRSGDLEKVPIDFPLERTHREIHEDASVVASRISEALRKLSIETEYAENKAKAKCRTSDFVSFRIRLYDGGEGGLPVVVELQRRQGPAMSFTRTCKAILNAADGTAVTEKTMAKKGPPAFKVPGGIGGMKCLQGISIKPPSDAGFGLAKACELMRSEKRDCNLLGIGSLCNLTDPLKTDPQLALKSATAVVIGDDHENVRAEIETMRSRYLTEAELQDAPERGIDLFEEIHHKTLVAFSHSLTLTARAGVLERAVTEQVWFKEFLLPLLADELKKAESSPNNAHVAAVCVGCLVQCSPVGKHLVLELCGMEVLRSANEIGNACHELLANETKICISALGASA